MYAFEVQRQLRGSTPSLLAHPLLDDLLSILMLVDIDTLCKIYGGGMIESFQLRAVIEWALIGHWRVFQLRLSLLDGSLV